MPSQKTALREPSGKTLGTSASDRPLVPAGASTSRHNTRCTRLSVRSLSPPLMKILLPVMATGAPLAAAPAINSALVRTCPRSLPACGSVRHMVPSHSPLTSWAR